MNEAKAIPRPLRVGRRAIEAERGVRMLRDFRWHEHSGKWILHCELRPDVTAEGSIPEATKWYVLVDDDYPWGDIGFYPSKEGGLDKTHQHQDYNGTGDEAYPWRDGKLCLDTTVRVLGRQALDWEPFDAEERMLWHFERALAWLGAASRDELVIPGEPFELPLFPGASPRRGVVGFSEGPEDYVAWGRIEDRSGRVELLRLRDAPPAWVVDNFQSIGGEVHMAPEWGPHLRAERKERQTGIWIYLQDLPILPPWQAPTTWGELRDSCDAQGIDILDKFRPLARFLRNDSSQIALLGFPVPERAGEPPRQIHWQAMRVPTLSNGTQAADGFRPNEQGYWQRDRTQVLVNDTPLEWITSENWSPIEASRRGRLPADLTNMQVLIVGAGALGSCFAELLVRGGVRALVIMDGDLLQVGNLVRHTLTLVDMCGSKSEAVAGRLNQSAPHARVVGIDSEFPPTDVEDLAQVLQCDLVVDCTGSDRVLHWMEIFDWLGSKLFFSIWSGVDGRRLYCFSGRGSRFPHDRFRELVNPWLEAEFEEYDTELPREGIGCWHPVFPARADDVWLVASTGVKCLTQIVGSWPEGPQLSVYEQEMSGGIKRVALER